MKTFIASLFLVAGLCAAARPARTHAEQGSRRVDIVTIGARAAGQAAAVEAPQIAHLHTAHGA